MQGCFVLPLYLFSICVLPLQLFSTGVLPAHVQTVLRAFSHSSLATSLRNLRHKLPFSKDNSSHSCSSTVRQEASCGHHAAYHKVSATLEWRDASGQGVLGN